MKEYLEVASPVLPLKNKPEYQVTYPVSYTYNGGIIIDGEWYKGYKVDPPIIPEGYELLNIGVGLQLNARPPLATGLLKLSGILTAERIVKMSKNRTEVNRLFLHQDDSHLWPICGKYNVTKRAINRIRRLEREGLEFDDLLAYALTIEQITSEIVNNEV